MEKQEQKRKQLYAVIDRINADLGGYAGEHKYSIIQAIYDHLLGVDPVTDTPDGKIIASHVRTLPALDEWSDVNPLSDAYEYLLSRSSAKAGGQYFTPVSIADLMIEIAARIKPNYYTVYDPACGAGVLLQRATERFLGCSAYGQEMHAETAKIARMSYYIRHGSFPSIAIGDTLAEPANTEIQYSLVLANPPFSTRWDGGEDNDPRFSVTARAPKSRADMAFVLHSLYQLADLGTAVICCYPGILYRSGAEQKIRQYLVENNHVRAVVQLPPKMFMNTQISTCLLVLQKPDCVSSTVTFFDATEMCKKGRDANIITNDQIDEIALMTVERFARHAKKSVVSKKAIRDNDYNLSVSSYVSPPEKPKVTRDEIEAINRELDGLTERRYHVEKKLNQFVRDLHQEIYGAEK